jgi:hypothetical protein
LFATKIMRTRKERMLDAMTPLGDFSTILVVTHPPAPEAAAPFPFNAKTPGC